MVPRYDKSVNGGIQAFSQHVGLSGLPQKSKIILIIKMLQLTQKNSVIPAWMPEYRAIDGDYPWHHYPI